MLKHSASRRRSAVTKTVFKLLGPIVVQLFGYPLGMRRQQRAMKVMEYLSPKPNMDILDFGCSKGYYAFELGIRYDCKVLGFNVDREDIGLANRIKAILKINTVTFTNKRPDSIKYGNFFDCILVSEVLEHIQDDGKTLRQLASLLKQNGRIVVTVPYARNPKEYAKQHLKSTPCGHLRNGYNINLIKNRIKGTRLVLRSWTRCCRGLCLLVVL